MACQGILTESYTDSTIENSRLSLTGLHQLTILLNKMTSLEDDKKELGIREWLVESDKSQHRENNKKGILFCRDIPGSGKTMIVSIVVDHLFKKFRNDPGIAIAFLYFNFRQQQEQERAEVKV